MVKENNLNRYRKETIKLTVPVFLELMVSSLFGMIDMMMVGNSGPAHITTPSIAAIGITNQVILIGIAVAQAMGSAGTAIISRYYGAERTEKIPNVVKHLIIILIGVLIIPFAMATQLFPKNIMNFIGADQGTIDIGYKYFIAMSFGFLFQAFNLGVFAAIRGEGDTRTPMMINISSNIINVLGNYTLIFGKFGFPALGITGAGIATAFSHIVAAIISIIILLNKSRIVRLDLTKRFKFDKITVQNLFKIGGPAAIEQVAFRLGVVVFIRMITGLGTVVYATHQIASNIVSLSFAPGQAFGIAASTLVGRSLGEERIDRAETYVKESNRLSLIVSVFFLFLFYFFGPTLTAIYTDDQSVITESINVMKVIAFIQPFQSSAFAISGGLRGAGDTVWTLIITMFGVIVIRLSVAYVLINIVELGLVGAWTAMLFDQVVRWIGITLRYRTGKWKEIELK